MRLRKATAILALVALVAIAGCSSYLENLAKTGDTLAIAGDLFVTTGNMYDSLYRDKKIDEAEYGPWREFALVFKQVYPSAVDAWKTAKAHPNVDSGELDEILSLSMDLAQKLFEFYSKAFVKTTGGA